MKTKRKELGWHLAENTKTGEQVFVAFNPNDKEDICVMTMLSCFLEMSVVEKEIWSLIYTKQILDEKPYFVGTIKYISSWIGVGRMQTSRYVNHMLDNGYIRRVDGVPDAYQIVEDSPVYLEALEFQKDPMKEVEKYEAEMAAKRAAKREAKKKATVTSD